MSELRALVEAASALRAAGTAFISATVVQVQGSAYRRPGARMIATENAWQAGSISAGCLERDVLGKGFWRTREARAVRVRYAEADDALEDARGSGCQGVIDYLVERWEPSQPLAADDPWACFARCIRDEQSGVLVTVIGSEDPATRLGQRAWLCAGELMSGVDDPALRAQLTAAAEAGLSGPAQPWLLHQGRLALLVEKVLPPPHLYIFGSGPDVSPVLELAKQLGWSVSIWDGSPRFSVRERLRSADHYLCGSVTDAVDGLTRAARPLAMIMGHDLARDQEVLGALLTCAPLYLGVLGPRRRTEQMLARLRATGVSPSDAALSRLHGPAGLALGAQTPAEIALSIVAEMQQALHAAAQSG